MFHIAERHAGLLPDDANARARAIAWMFAALNTVEPPIVELESPRSWSATRPGTRSACRSSTIASAQRLGELSSRLGDADWLDGAFSAGDLLMVTVLRRLNGSGLLEEYPNLSAYVARGEARPAYKRAFADQLAVFTGKPPAGDRRPLRARGGLVRAMDPNHEPAPPSLRTMRDCRQHAVAPPDEIPDLAPLAEHRLPVAPMLQRVLVADLPTFVLPADDPAPPLALYRRVAAGLPVARAGAGGAARAGAHPLCQRRWGVCACRCDCVVRSRWSCRSCFMTS